MQVNVIVREVLERKLKLVTKSNTIKEYTLDVEPADVFNVFEEARQVWAEYDVMFENNDFRLVKSQTYKEELAKLF
jgi:hypothetical protein